jgi:hypothetical protein
MKTTPSAAPAARQYPAFRSTPNLDGAANTARQSLWKRRKGSDQPVSPPV